MNRVSNLGVTGFEPATPSPQRSALPLRYTPILSMTVRISEKVPSVNLKNRRFNIENRDKQTR
ncbi:hypothetical protein LEP1GSC161_0995 [Leptospira santarosai str. CBC1416]|uniref:Uncharacterized protein n=1 Tax=Leptospira santarosai str. CBC1416 TaxID=1193059 RepID=M6VTK6_9LEPT|nr:hypothetical protein LEP1GSC161_0995 [Leptospira santarosai str. CBC1416]